MVNGMTYTIINPQKAPVIPIIKLGDISIIYKKVHENTKIIL